MTDDSDIDYTDDDDDDHQLNPQWKTLKKLEKSYRNIKKGNEIEKRFSPNCSEARRSSLVPPPVAQDGIGPSNNDDEDVAVDDDDDGDEDDGLS